MSVSPATDFGSLDDLVSQMTPTVIQWRRHFHRLPERGWLEFGTTAYLSQTLEELGFEVHVGSAATEPSSRLGVPSEEEREAAWRAALRRGAPPDWLNAIRGAGTGLVAQYDSGKPGPMIAIRCDIDALPIAESSSSSHRPTLEDWASVDPTSMHACGHDGHMAIVLAVASVVKQLRIPRRGRLRLLLQPAEEGARGGAAMARAGTVDDVDFLLCFHLGLGVPTGLLVAGANSLLATTRSHCEFTGRAAHAGLEPELGRNALLASAHAALSLHSLPQHSAGAARMNVGVIQAGVAENVVPDRAVLTFQTRGQSNAIDVDMNARAVEVVEGAAAMYGCDVHLQVMGQALAVNSNPDLAHRVCEELNSSLTSIESVEGRGFGASEDASFLMSTVHERGGQATYLMIGSDLYGGHHSPLFDFDEASLAIGIRALARALVLLAD